MADHAPYFTKKQFEARVSAQTARDIYDDNNDGTADMDTIDGLRRDATSKVDSYLAPLGVLPLNPNALPDEVVRLSLDVAVALAAQRHPEVMRKDWTALMKQAESDLSALRDGKTMLGQAPAPVPANHGAKVVEGDAARVDEPTQSWWDDMGLF